MYRGWGWGWRANFLQILSWISNKTFRYFTGYPCQKNSYLTGNPTFSLTNLLDFFLRNKLDIQRNQTILYWTSHFSGFPKLISRYLLDIQQNLGNVSLLLDIQANTRIFNVFFCCPTGDLRFRNNARTG